MSQYWPRSALSCVRPTARVFQVFQGSFTFLTLFRFVDLWLEWSQIGSKEIASWIEMCDRAQAFVPPLFSWKKVGLLSLHFPAFQRTTRSNARSYCILQWIRHEKKQLLSLPRWLFPQLVNYDLLKCWINYTQTTSTTFAKLTPSCTVPTGQCPTGHSNPLSQPE